MKENPQDVPLLKQPSAWIPLAMSLVALAFVLGYAWIFGIVQHADERAPARIFQLILAAELPIAAYFALKWLPQRTIPALLILGLQTAAWLVPVLTVLWLEGL